MEAANPYAKTRPAPTMLALRPPYASTEHRPYAAFSLLLPALLRCTKDLRLAMGASSSSAIKHATPSDTKYACAAPLTR